MAAGMSIFGAGMFGVADLQFGLFLACTKYLGLV